MSMAKTLRFAWVDPYVAGFSEPNYPEKIEFILSQGIHRIVSLTPQPLKKEWVNEYSLHKLHVPIKDNGVPTKEQVNEFISFISNAVNDGHKVRIHCKYGQVRTRMMLALYLISYQKRSLKEAILR